MFHYPGNDEDLTNHICWIQPTQISNIINFFKRLIIQTIAALYTLKLIPSAQDKTNNQN